MTTWLGAIGWPHVALIFAVFFALLFRKELSAFIARIRSVGGKLGVEAGAPSPEIQNEKKSEAALAELMNIGDSVVLKEAEHLIKVDLEKRDISAQDSVRVLTRHLAATQLSLDYEQIHSRIFGSQIYLLKRLNEVQGQGKPPEFIEEHFERVRAVFPELADWSLQQYMTFFYARTLVISKDGNVHITQKGVDYLVWVARTGHNEDKRL